MMKFHLIAVAVLCFAVIQSTNSLSCPCWRVPINCTELTEADCPFGTTSDICGCCSRCKNGPGEECGGPWNAYEPCGDGHKCVKNPNATPEEPRDVCLTLQDTVGLEPASEHLLF
ncbi:venom protein 302-like [Palaemon carinicauda]|uniref:venom protein 302-like n=1 Tax=Palaemon carinicauda TaxID=392227 RepID=UPI0035B6449A